MLVLTHMLSQYKAGDVVVLETARKGKHYVYALIDDTNAVFYIGRSWDPRARLRQHVYSGVPAVRARLKACKEPRLRIVAGPVSAREAERLEKAMIASHPGTLNQEHRIEPAIGGAKRLPVFEQFRKPVPPTEPADR